VKAPIPINGSTWWIGVNDRETDLFESIWPLPRGVSYNSYLLADEKVAVVDTVKSSAFDAYLAKIRRVLGPERTVDYVVINHMEPDHSGSLRLLREVFPHAQLVGSKKTIEFLGHLYGITDNTRIVGHGDELDLGDSGGHTLRFALTPMVHWPETMMTYDTAHQILFSGDAFGGFGALDGGIFDDEVDVDYFDDEILRYFSNIVGKYCPMVQRALAKLQGTPIKVVAPTHGPVWRADPGRILGAYDRWSRYEADDGVVLAYASMYGNTTSMMESVAKGLLDAGFPTVRVHDASRTHVSYIVRDAWRYKGIILGSPTYDTGLFPPMANLVNLLAEKKLKGRILGVFGSYGWSGGGVKALTEFAAQGDYNLLEPVVEARFAPTPTDIEACRLLGRTMAERIRAASA